MIGEDENQTLQLIFEAGTTLSVSRSVKIHKLARKSFQKLPRIPDSVLIGRKPEFLDINNLSLDIHYRGHFSYFEVIYFDTTFQSLAGYF